MPAEERSHARVFKYLAGETSGLEAARWRGSRAGTSRRAATCAGGVLGANDGLVSVFSLVMGVAGAQVPPRTILVTGLAGLLAGAFHGPGRMAVGAELARAVSAPAGNREVRAGNYPRGREGRAGADLPGQGDRAEAARDLADRLLSDDATALDTLAREELAIDPQELGGSAWEAALTSFFLFSLGAIIPVVPYIFLTGLSGIVASAILSAAGLFIIGAAITLMTGRNPVVSGLRQVLFGLATAAITFGIGRLIGTSV